MKEIHDFTIVERQQKGDQYFMLVVKHGGTMQPVQAGQFVEILVEDSREVMLRRPISVHDVDAAAGTMSLLIQVVGNGTRKLSTLKVGDKLNLVYPLGHGFTTDIAPASKVLLVGGGAGIAPLLHLSKVLSANGIKPTVLLGGRTASLIPVRSEFEPYATVHISTDDGSLGHHGIVTTHPVFSERYDMIYTCGPTPMMKAVARSAAERGIRCEVSLENMMACGVGACLCCVTDTDEGHKCVCKDGPVFDATKLKNFHVNN
ncbi:MAG: dihydroorotate dehydrogenase electron transfer subunit [Bacteroidales bacterium]|nr:dihydroorotate dehydrogenase electron transfer subunit [Bacteroidales bacterium]